MYNSAKAAQILAFFAMKEPAREINRLKAVKLLYLADRESMKRFAFPMLDEPRASLPFGPVNSKSLDLMRERENDETFRSYVRSKTRMGQPLLELVRELTEDDLDELSDAELEIVTEVWAEFGERDRFDIVDWTHDQANVPEWEDPGQSSKPITIQSILAATGHDHVEELSERIAEHNRIDDVLCRLQKEVAR